MAGKEWWWELEPPGHLALGHMTLGHEAPGHVAPGHEAPAVRKQTDS